MAETVWINGEFMDKVDARVSAFDAAVQHGVGLFETMRATSEGVADRDRHLERLAASARELGLTEQLRIRALGQAVDLVAERSGLTAEGGRARVRLTLTGGDLNLLSSTGRGPTDPTIIISAQPATVYPAEMFEKGVGVLIATAKANPLNPFEGHKTVNYWWRLRELQAAAAAGMGEALVLQVTNHVTGGCVSNVFAVRDGALLTPLARGEEDKGGVPSPVLPGITRESVVEAANGMGIGCRRALMTISDVLDADEVFLTNSSWGVLPVVRIEGKQIGSGLPGEMTNRFMQRLAASAD